MNVGQIQAAIDKGLLSSSVPITERDLLRSGLLKRGKYFARVLGDGEIMRAIHLEVPYASRAAIDKVKNAGGTVKILHKDEIESSLPQKYVYKKGPGDNLRREIVARLGGALFMHLRTNIKSNMVKKDQDIKVFLEIDVHSDDMKLSKEQLNDFSVYFDGYGAVTKDAPLNMAEVFEKAAKNNGRFETEVVYRSERSGEIELLIGVAHAGSRLVRRSHTLHCL